MLVIANIMYDIFRTAIGGGRVSDAFHLHNVSVIVAKQLLEDWSVDLVHLLLSRLLPSTPLLHVSFVIFTGFSEINYPKTIKLETFSPTFSYPFQAI
jgi:hypothetical protein